MKPTGTALPRLAVSFVLVGVLSGVCLASGGMSSSFSEGVIQAGKIFNALVLFGGLFFLLRKPLKNFFAHRTAEIQKQLQEAEAARTDAEAKLAEAQARLDALAEEIARIRAQAETDAEAMRLALIQRADEDMERFRARSRIEIESLTKQALDELKLYAADRSAEAARALLKAEIRAEDETALFDRFLQGLGGRR